MVPSCPNCGEDNPQRARFCLSCAAPLPSEVVAPAHVRKTVTLVFSDVAGSTAMGEGRDPEAVRAVMDRYFAAMRSVLERHGGTVEKFVGDAVMAAFGIPHVHEDDALRAVRAAAEMRDTLNALNDELEAEWGVRIAVRTGVNTGEVIAGDASTRETFATGDTVNTTARLEQAAGAGEILLGERTYSLVRDAVSVEPVDPLTLKGKSEPVPSWRLVSVSKEAAGRARRLDAPLVGREHELSLLRAAFDRAVAGSECRLVTVMGSPGVGKTRLVSELLAGLHGRANVLRGRCLSYGEGITFWPIAEVLRQAATISDEDPPDQVRRKLSEIVAGADDDSESIAAGLEGLLGLGTPWASIEETFWAIRRGLETLAAARPVVLVIEDIHGAEPTLLDLIEHLVDRARNASLLLSCTTRPDLVEVRPGWGTGPRSSTVRLEPLGEYDAERLIGALLGGADLRRDLRTRIAEAGGGNPLFVEEMLSMLIDDGVLRRSNGGWVATTDLAQVAVPPTISAVISARLDRLAAGERAVAERASVIGAEFERPQVSALVSPEESNALPERLATLENKEFITRQDVVDLYRFRHILIHNEVYAGMAKLLRADLHERFAEWLVAWAGERSGEYEEIIGYHFERAYRYLTELRPEGERERALADRARRHLAHAGKNARARSDVAAAAKLLDRAADLCATGDRDRLELLVDLAGALTQIGEFARAEGALAEALEGAEELGDEALRAGALVERGSLLLARPPETSLRQLQGEANDLIRTFEALGDDRGLATAWRLLANTHWETGDLGAMEDAVQAAVKHAERAGMPWVASAALALSVEALSFGPVPVSQALERCEGILGAERPSPRVVAGALLARAYLLAMLGRFEEARSTSDQAVLRFREMGMDPAAAGASHFRGAGELLAGDPVGAERELRAGYVLLEAMGERDYLSTSAALLAEALAAQGRHEEAEEFTRTSEELSAPDDLASQVGWRTARARALAGLGQADQAVELAREAVKRIEATDWLVDHADAVMRLAEVLAAAGKDDEALARAEEALRLHELKGNVVAAGKARALANEIRSSRASESEPNGG